MSPTGAPDFRMGATSAGMTLSTSRVMVNAGSWAVVAFCQKKIRLNIARPMLSTSGRSFIGLGNAGPARAITTPATLDAASDTVQGYGFPIAFDAEYAV